MSTFDKLNESIAEAERLRDIYPYGSENWKFFNRDIERMREEIREINKDEIRANPAYEAQP